MHTHRPATHELRPYIGPVAATIDDENVAAHGNVCEVQRCRCGAVRSVNINGRHRERGPWVEMTDQTPRQSALWGALLCRLGTQRKANPS